MGEITTVGLDLAKQVFQVHAVDGAGQVVLRKSLRRGQVLTFFAGLPRMPGRDRGLRHGAPLGA